MAEALAEELLTSLINNGKIRSGSCILPRAAGLPSLPFALRVVKKSDFFRAFHRGDLDKLVGFETKPLANTSQDFYLAIYGKLFAELNDKTTELLKPFFNGTIRFDLDNSGLKSEVKLTLVAMRLLADSIGSARVDFVSKNAVKSFVSSEKFANMRTAWNRQYKELMAPPPPPTGEAIVLAPPPPPPPPLPEVLVEFPSGQKQFFEGGNSMQRMVRAEFLNGTKQFYAGEKGAERLVRDERANGQAQFFEGEQGAERVVRAECANGEK